MGRKRETWTDEKLFFRLLNNKTERTYWENIGELRKRPTQQVFETAYKLAKSNIEKEIFIGILVLAQLGVGERPFRKETVKLYFELLSKEGLTEELMESILISIGHNNENLNQSQVLILSNFKTHNNDEVRRGLVFSLLGVELNIAIDILIFLMKDKDDAVRDWATFGIGRQIEVSNEKIIEALWARFNDKDETTKFEAIVGLAIRKVLRIKDIIHEEIKQGEFGTLLFEAIEELEDKSFLPSLSKLLRESENEEDITKDWLDALKNCIDNLKKL